MFKNPVFPPKPPASKNGVFTLIFPFEELFYARIVIFHILRRVAGSKGG